MNSDTNRKPDLKFLSTKAVLLPLLLGLVCAAGCQAPSAPTPPPEPVVAPVTPPPPPVIERQLLFKLLDDADAAIADNRLTFPAGHNALDYYHDILAIQPDQEDALRGLEQLVEIYVKLAQDALEYNRFATARSMLVRADLIVPNHPSIEPTQAQIRLLEEAQRTALTLDQQTLNNPTRALKDQLIALGSHPAKTPCRFIIYARSDAQGRWIYQQLAAAEVAGRIRAEIKIRTPAKVERLCFPT
ncbi:MAG: hypothetical protein V2I41_00330 [Pseudomonadales bacterium]|nr:hypothetical protein [Pseudomonadales bacterium]